MIEPEFECRLTIELTGATEAVRSGEEGWQSVCYDTGFKRLRPG